MPIFKKGTAVMIQIQKRCMLLGMFSFMKINLFFSQSECSLQEERGQNIFEDNTLSPSLPSPDSPDLPSPSPSLPSPDLPHLPSPSPSLPSPDLPHLPSLSPSQDSTPQSVPDANESSDVHSEVNSFPLNSPTTEPRYPLRINRGIPKKQYDPDIHTKAKYPINNFISTHHLSESYVYTINQLSTISILSNV